MNRTGKEEIDKAKKLASLSVAYILRLISEGKNDEQTAERFDGNGTLVKHCIGALYPVHLITRIKEPILMKNIILIV